MPNERIATVIDFYKDVSELLETYKQDVFNIYKAIETNDRSTEQDMWKQVKDDKLFINNKLAEIEQQIILIAKEKNNI